MRYLVDSDWVIDYLRGVLQVVNRLNDLREEGIGLSIVSLAELYDGVLGADNPRLEEQTLRNFLGPISVVHLDEIICRIFARERVRLRNAGRLISDLDLLIGSTAVRHNLTLLTNNRRHFERLQGLAILSV